MILIVGDLHLTDHSRDAYRFGIFNWIAKQQKKLNPAATFLLGDITDAKDRHSATLVNKIVSGLVSLKPPVFILKGNHDYSDPENPFFKFLNHIDGIKFVVDPLVINVGRPIGLIPHYRQQADFDAAVACGAVADAFLVHQTFDGAIAESGVRLTGLSASPIESLKPPLGVYAGDVHKPQRQGQVLYVGCPYHVRFGDNFEPRVLIHDLDPNHAPKNLYFEAPRKWALTVRGPENILNNENLCVGDQVKLTIQVSREEVVEWKKIKHDVLQACRDLKLDIFGVKVEVRTTQRRERLKLNDKYVSNADTFEQFCKTENVASKYKQTGMEILENGN